MRAFTDIYKETLEVDDYGGGELLIRAIANSCHDTDVVTVFHPSDARAVAAEIIACADRIEGKDTSGPRKCKACGETQNRSEYMTCINCDAMLDNAIREYSDSIKTPTPTQPSTPTHTSHASLVVFAKAIAYLPQPMRDELNALLASKLRVALS